MAKPELKRVEQLFHEAVARDASERHAFLEAACAGDADLRAAVEDLLRHDRASHSGGDYLISPVAQQAEQYRLLAPTILDVSLLRPAPPRSPLPSIPGYEVLEEIGQGGMGVVYKARQIALNRLVALKMLLPASGATTEALVRFRGEAEALARLQHPNIVAVYDIGESEGRPYFTMEYIAGPSLAQVVNGRPQEAAVSAHLLEVVARAMHAVHQCGIIHRDLKPANILLAAGSGQQAAGSQLLPIACCPLPAIPKITDFGLAKDWTSERRLTQSGVTMGTPCNMAPEQVRNKRGQIGPAADTYALGTVLYEMLTGRPPFDAGSPAETIAQVLNDEPISPLRLRPGLPRDLATICLKCLDKAPSQRYATALELAEDLRRFQAGEPIRARHVGLVQRTYRWCRRRPLVSGLLALSLSLAVALVSYAIVAEIRLRKALETRVVHLNVEIGLSELRDGDTFQAILHFAEALRLDEGSPHEDEDRQHIAEALRQCPELVGLLHLDSRILCADFAAAGGRIVTVGPDHSVAVWDLAAGCTIIRGLTHADAPRHAAISPDGRFLAVAGVNGTATIWHLTTGKSQELPKVSGEAVERFLFHPDGAYLLTQYANGAVRLWNLKTGAGVWSETTPQRAGAGAWPSEDGRWLLTVDPSHEARLWDIGKAMAEAGIVQPGQPVSAAAISANGRLAVVHPDGELTIWDVVSGKLLAKLNHITQKVRRLALSADGKQLALACSDDHIQVWEVGAAKMLAHFASKEHAITSLHFSPDGRFLLTRSEEDGAHVWDVEGRRSATPLLKHGGPLAAAGFGAKSGHVGTVSADGLVCFWKLSHIRDLKIDNEGSTLGPAPEQRSVQALIALAEALAGNHLDEKEERQALDALHLLQAWERWKASR
jgi:serine/threonine protein kinase/WD40 repeat protein